MSFYRFMTCDSKLEAYDNTGTEMLSHDEAVKKGYHVSELWRSLSSDDEVMYIEDEDKMDNLHVISREYHPLEPRYSKKTFISDVSMRFDDVRSQELIHYIKKQISMVNEIEFWVLLLDQDTQVVRKKISISDLSFDVLEEYFVYDFGRYPRCLTITRD